MKIVILGGSAHSTPHLFMFFSHQANLPRLHFVLVGRCVQRLCAVRRAAIALLGPQNSQVDISIAQIDNFRSILNGTHIVLLQVRIGGFEGRIFDEAMPVAFDVCGDQDLGPGAVSAGWRGWPHIQSYLSQIAELIPNAAVVMLSSPTSILVRAAACSFPYLDIFGICEVPWTALTELSQHLGVLPEKVDFDYVGVHHFGWFYRAECDSTDLLAAYLSTPSSSLQFPEKSLVSRFQGFPTKYVRLHCYRNETLKQQRVRPGLRGIMLQKYRAHALRVFETGNSETIKEALTLRPAPWYEHAIGHLILGIAGRTMTAPIFLSKRNNGYEPELPGHDVLEIPHALAAGKLGRLAKRAPVPHDIAIQLNDIIRFERHAAYAILHRDPALLREAIRLHPWVHCDEAAKGIGIEIIRASERLQH